MGMDNSSVSSGFNISGNVDGSMNMGNYSTVGTFNSLLSTVTQLLLVALIVSFVVGLAIWVKNKYFQESFNKGKQAVGNDPMLKTIVVLAFTLVGVVVVGLVTSWSVSGILTFFIQMLTIVFVVGLVAFLFTYVKPKDTH